MYVTNCGRGVHAREAKGIEKLRNALPNTWYAFTNLDLAVGVGKSREIDVIIVADDRIFILDLKDWHGKIETKNGHWYQNGQDRGPSPVAKISANKRDIYSLLTKQLKMRPETKNGPIPQIIGLVALISKADITDIAAGEASCVLYLDDFIKIATHVPSRISNFGPVPPQFVAEKLTDTVWKDRLARFFNVKTGHFLEGKRRYDRFVANSDKATFTHKLEVFREYDAEDESTSQNLGTLRVWDFTKCPDTNFQTESGRKEIAGRESKVYYYLRDRNGQIENSMLAPKSNDPNYGPAFWDIYDRRKNLKRVKDFLGTEVANLSSFQRIELARQTVSKVAAIHECGAAHLDLADHSVWLEAPSTVKISHLMAAKFPEIRSLGEARYQFLSSVICPEDLLSSDFGPKRKDVYLLAIVVHQILFGTVPKSRAKDDPPEWHPEVDADRQFEMLHDWLACGLDCDAEKRFEDAIVALEAFNKAIESRPTPKEVLEILDTFRTDVKGQRQLFSKFPEIKTLAQTDRVDVWKSQINEMPVVVKMWSRRALGDLVKEGPRIVDFLNRAKDSKLSPLSGCAKIVDVLWLDDALALVHEWIEGETLSEHLKSQLDYWKNSENVLKFSRSIVGMVTKFHDRGYAHGDLKPSNIIIKDDAEKTPYLIDILDYSSSTDGDIVSSAYAPEGGNKEERDNFAVTKIIEEILSTSDVAPQAKEIILQGIKDCRSKPPTNGTLLPLSDAIELVLNPQNESTRVSINIAIKDAVSGPMVADEGKFFIRTFLPKNALYIRGACEELEIFLDNNYQPAAVRRRSVDQQNIARRSRFEFKSIVADISVVKSTINDFKELTVLLEDSEIIQALKKKSEAASAQQEAIDVDDAEEPGELADEILVEEAFSISATPPTSSVNVPHLWKTLIDVERDLTIEGIASADSTFDRNSRRHLVPFELSNGNFDFDRNDRVGVQKLDPRGHWKRIGELDISRSKPNLICIDADNKDGGGKLVSEEEHLRFSSHFELQSFRRRESAIETILSREAKIPDLVNIFDARNQAEPTAIQHELDENVIQLYGLNDDQKEALNKIVKVRPLGLLQGPPGTGKTKFIAALSHYVLTKGLARNILLSSQSHEAVNNAAEALLELFKKSKQQPSILRVGMEGVVSQRLLPYHTDNIEKLFKDQFQAEIKGRLRIAGSTLGLPSELFELLIFIETSIRPVLEKLIELNGILEKDSVRIDGLRQTLDAHLKHIKVDNFAYYTEENSDATISALVDELIRQRFDEWKDYAEKAERFGFVAKISRDFISCVSGPQRSFEPFLAGTRQIVVGTCVGLGRSSLGLTNTAFDLVIIDEAARCTPSELAVPMQAGRWVVLVGDQAQLPPFHKPEVVTQVSAQTRLSKREVLRSDLDRVFSSHYGSKSSLCLKKQYRMIPPIGQLVSDTFYGNLTHGRHEAIITENALPPILANPLTWLSTDNLGERGCDTSHGTSRINRSEAQCIIKILKLFYYNPESWEWLSTQREYPHGIGVICMYGAQRDFIRRQLRDMAFGEHLLRHVKIDTVDSYQGKENPIVIVSLVRNNFEGNLMNGVASVKPGFLIDSSRINVAFSRAMDRLLVVGVKSRWLANSPMGRLNNNFDKAMSSGHGALINASEFLEEVDPSDDLKKEAGKGVKS